MTYKITPEMLSEYEFIRKYGVSFSQVKMISKDENVIDYMKKKIFLDFNYYSCFGIKRYVDAFTILNSSLIR